MNKLQVCKAISGYMYLDYYLGDAEIKEYVDRCRDDNVDICENSLIDYLYSCSYDEDVDVKQEEYIHIEGLEEFLNKCKEYDASRN